MKLQTIKLRYLVWLHRRSMRRLDKLMQEDAAWKRLNILTDKLREIKNLDELPSLKYPVVKYIESPIPVEGYAQKTLLRNKLLRSIDNISPFFIPEEMKVRLYGELDDIIKAVHEYDKSIGADSIGVALKREEGESASSYLSRCLYPEYRNLFYESNDYIREKEFKKICGDQDEYIARYVETHIKGYDRHRPAIENWGRMLARHFMGMGVKMKMDSLPRWRKLPEDRNERERICYNTQTLIINGYWIDLGCVFEALEKEE